MTVAHCGFDISKFSLKQYSLWDAPNLVLKSIDLG